MNISFVIPVHNEATGIFNYIKKGFLPSVESASKKLKFKYSVILVNDGSHDGTLSELWKLSDKNKAIRIVDLSRNFGKEIAMTAGIHEALKDKKIDAIFTMDADGQHPPKYIEQFIVRMQSNNAPEIITGVREKYNNEHGFVAKTGSKLFYLLLKLMGNKETVPGTTDFRLISRHVAEEFSRLAERNRINRSLIDWLGYHQAYIPFNADIRKFGRPSFGFRKLFKLAISSFISLSPAPLFIFTWVGVFITCLSALLGLFVIVQQHILNDPMNLEWDGGVQLGIFISFLVGLVLISQGITALYIAQIQSEVLNRPLYLVNKQHSRNLNN